MEATKSAVRSFKEKQKVEGYFSDGEQDVLWKTLTDACGIPGKMFDPRTEAAWSAVYKLCLMAGRISATRTKPVVAAVEDGKPTCNLTPAEPTPADLRRAYFNDVVVTWRGKRYTASDVDKMSSQDYKDLVGQTGYDGGKIARNMNQILTHVGGQANG